MQQEVRGAEAGTTLGDVVDMVKDVTGEYVMGPDWAVFTRLGDIINANPHKVKPIIKALEKRLKHKDAQTQMLALQLTESFVLNCPTTHPYIGGADFQKTLFSLLNSKKTKEEVKLKGLTLVQTYNQAFQKFDRRIFHFCQTYEKLLSKGALFPSLCEADTVPVFTPPASHNVRPSHELESSADYYGAPNVQMGRVPAGVGYIVQPPPMRQEAPRNAPVGPLDLPSINSSLSIFKEVLGALEPNDPVRGNELLTELREAVKEHQRTLQTHIARVAEEGPESLLVSLLETNDEVSSALSAYNARVAEEASGTENRIQSVTLVRPDSSSDDSDASFTDYESDEGAPGGGAKARADIVYESLPMNLLDLSIGSVGGGDTGGGNGRRDPVTVLPELVSQSPVVSSDTVAYNNAAASAPSASANTDWLSLSTLGTPAATQSGNAQSSPPPSPTFNPFVAAADDAEASAPPSSPGTRRKQKVEARRKKSKEKPDKVKKEKKAKKKNNLDVEDEFDAFFADRTSGSAKTSPSAANNATTTTTSTSTASPPTVSLIDL